MPLRSLCRLALAFVLLFATLVLTSLFPLQLLDPAWQGRVSRTLLDSASLPLLALALLQIGRWLDPADPLLKRRQRSFSRLAGVGALGFLLLVPVQISASLRLQQARGAEQSGRIAEAERQLAAFRQAVQQASSSEALASSLEKLGGPRPAPADLALPLPVLKAQANAALDQVQLAVRRQRAALPASNPLRQIPELLRPCTAALILAFAFASLARGPEDSDGSLLDQLLRNLSKRGLNLPGSRSRDGDPEASYRRQLKGDDPG
ncbi:MAG: HpsJ family protein [Sphaerospermopsis kisseleviana]